ncbi:MAG: beta-N-acetylglucosaminidase domain-containing protein [Alphaproteobacteria bacterium]
MPRHRSRLRAALLAAACALLPACGDTSSEPPPAFRVRGTIEGFYGPPYDRVERERLIRFGAERGLNAWVHAPKLDPKHRDRWRDPYTAQELADFAALASVGDDVGTRVRFAISPGQSFDPSNPGDDSLLAQKLGSVHDAGVRGFALLLDDISEPGAPVLDPTVQARLVARFVEIVEGFGDGSDAWFIGPLYAGSAEEILHPSFPGLVEYPAAPAAYWDAYAALVPPHVPVMWTGPGVISGSIPGEVARGFRELARRPVIVWDNVPVNDVFPRDLFLGPVTGRGADLVGEVDGVVFNLMTQPTAGLVAVATGADWLRDPARYDPEASFARAVADVGGPAAEPFARFADLHRGHPLLDGSVDAPELARRIDDAFGANGSAEGRARLRAHLDSIATLEADLRRRAEPALVADIEPWLAKTTALARAARLGLDALDGGASAAAWREARDRATALPVEVAADHVSDGFAAFNATTAKNTDRFADLFARIEAGLSK